MAIPKIAHRIWFGEPFIDKYKLYLQELASLNPDFVIKVWSDPEVVSQESYDELLSFCKIHHMELCPIRQHRELVNYESIIEELEASKNTITHKKLHYVRASDIARIAVLFSEGGIYSDTDSKMLQPFPQALLDKKIAIKSIGPESKSNVIWVEGQQYQCFVQQMMYDFIAAEPNHPLLQLTTEINRLDYKTYHLSNNTQWQDSSDYHVLCWGTIRLTGTALKYAINFMHQSMQLNATDMNALFVDVDDFMQADYDKSWLDGFDIEASTGEDSILDIFLNEINYNRQAQYITNYHDAPSLIPSSIIINTYPQLKNALQNLPSRLYKCFWETVIIKKPGMIRSLACDIRRGDFHCENKQALAAAFLANYSRFCLDEPILFWLVNASDIVFLQEALRIYDKDQIAQALKEHNKYGFTPLQGVKTPEFIKMALGYLPQDQRLDVVNTFDKNGSALIMTISEEPELLNAVFESLTEIQRPEAIKLWDEIGCTAISHFIRYEPQCLALILSQFPKNQRFDAITQVNKFGFCALSTAAENPSTIAILLAALPEDKRLALLAQPIGDQSILHLLLNNKIMVSPKESAFQDSFAPHYIAICHCIDEQMSLGAKTQGLFSLGNHAAKLSNELRQYDCFEDIQQHLLDYVKRNPFNSLAKEIARLSSEWPSIQTSSHEQQLVLTYQQ